MQRGKEQKGEGRRERKESMQGGTVDGARAGRTSLPS